jgi:hypothetical protein
MHDPHRLHGGCHCDNIRWTLDWPDPLTPIPVRACDCDHCTKHGAAWTSHPGGRFQLLIGDESRATRYRFGTKTADFHVCSTCGVVPIVTCMIDGARHAVVNVNTLEDGDRSRLVKEAASFTGESTEKRLARRRRNWTPEAVGGRP